MQDATGPRALRMDRDIAKAQVSNRSFEDPESALGNSCWETGVSLRMRNACAGRSSCFYMCVCPHIGLEHGRAVGTTFRTSDIQIFSSSRYSAAIALRYGLASSLMSARVGAFCRGSACGVGYEPAR